MRTGEQSRAVTRLTQDRFDNRGGGAFALGAGDVDGAASMLGFVEPAEQGADAIEGEIRLGSARSGAALEVGVAHQPGRGIVVARERRRVRLAELA